MQQEPVDVPVIMVAGASGTIGAPLCQTLKAMGGRVAPVSRKSYDFRSEREVSLALLTAKPDIVINATSSLQGGPADAFRGTMSIGLNLIHACSAARIRLILLEAPPMVWPWEEAQAVRTFLNAQNALEAACDAYVAQHQLNAAIIRLPMVYAHDARRSDPISVIVAHVCKATRNGLKEYSVPFHKDSAFSMMHPSDAAAAVVSIGASGRVGPAEVAAPAPVTCAQIVDIASREARCPAAVQFGSQQPVVQEASSWQDRRVDVPIKIRVEDEIRRMVGYMLGGHSHPAAAPAPAVAAAKENP